MTKPITSQQSTFDSWRTNTNQVSENLGDPVNLFVTDGVSVTHNADSTGIALIPFTNPGNAASSSQSVLVETLNHLNLMKVKRTGDSITGSLRIDKQLHIGEQTWFDHTQHTYKNATTTLVASSATTLNLFASTVSTANVLSDTLTLNLNATRVSGTHVVNIATGASTSGSKTVKLATGGTTGSTNTLQIGTNGGTTPTTLISGVTTLDNTTDNSIGTVASGAVKISAGGLGVFGNSTFGKNIHIGSTAGTTTSITTTVTGIFNVLNANATTINAFGAATTILVGATTGTARIQNADVYLNGDLTVEGGDVVLSKSAGQTTQTVISGIAASTVELFKTANTIRVDLATVAPTVNIQETIATGTVVLNLGTGLTSSGTKTVKLGTGGTAGVTAVSIGSNGGVTSSTLISGITTVDNTTDNTIGGLTTGALKVTTGGFAVFGNSTFGKNIHIGTTAGTTTSITTAVTGTFNVLNTNATTINAFGAATSITVGASAPGTMTVRNNTESTSTSTGGLVLQGGLGVAKRLNVVGDFLTQSSSTLGDAQGDGSTVGDTVRIAETVVKFGTLKVLTQGTSGAVVTLPKASYTSLDVILQVVDSASGKSNVQTTKMIINHDGTDVHSTEYANVWSSAVSPVTYAVTMDVTNIFITATANGANGNHTVKAFVTAMI